MSSPVALAGPGNQRTTASSIGCPPASPSSVWLATRAGGIFPASSFIAAPAAGPDTRTIAMALGGCPDERAKMVWSRGCIRPNSAVSLETAMLFDRTVNVAPQQIASMLRLPLQQSRKKKGRRWAPRLKAASGSSVGSGVHRLEEFTVTLGTAELVEQEVDPVHGPHRIEDAAEDVHFLQHLRI